MANTTDMPITPTFFATPAEFRNWLVEHHQGVRELWVGFYKKDSGKPSLTWPESLDDSAARAEWGWAPRYDLAAMVAEMLKELRIKLRIS